MTDYHIIVAAGSGSRFGSALPKQFCDMGGRPLLMTTIDRFRLLDPQARIIIVLSESMRDTWRQMCDQAGFDTSGLIVVNGGATRTASVSSALAAIDPSDAGWISVHDGARPVVSRSLIDNITAARAVATDGVIPVTAETDSIRELTASGASVAVDRSRYVRVQTPQSFPAAKLLEAYAKASLDGSASFTDDASVMEAAGMGDFTLVEGDPANIKVTRPGDIELAMFYLERMA